MAARRPRRRPLGATNRRLLAEALPALALASLAVKLAPFRRLAAWASRWGRGRTGEVDAAFLRKARWSVEAWAKRVPWRTVCFQKGLALHALLRARGIPSVLHYGVRQEPGTGLKAHVWVTVAGEPVIGGEEAPGFACLATFPPQQGGGSSRMPG
ncbi:MAG: lasso peptide biosynthesis B2 protein [Alphaproteobacteria bacterium]|nr:lasso peptide biosynthesis B2 protein [Alphaproteobacteria bacterium]